MAVAAVAQHVWFDSLAVVAHKQSKATAGIIQFNFYVRRICVTKCIDQSLSSDTVDLILKHRMQFSAHTLHNYLEVNLINRPNLILDLRESGFERYRAGPTRTQTSYRRSTFFD